MVTRRQFLGRAGLAVAAAMATPWAPRAAEARKPPNIVFILADDLGWGDLACYGHPHIRTPHLDQLAREGTLFTQAYAASPVCSPTRASLLTGRFPARDGVHGPMSTPEAARRMGMPDFLDPNLPMVTRLLQDSGYAVGHFGKWHLGGGEAAPESGAPPPTAYGIDTSYVFSGNGPGWKKDGEFTHRSSEWIVDKSIAFIEANRDRPFMVQTWLRDPHNPIRPTDAQRAEYPEFAGLLQGYYSVVSDLDRHVGRLLARLRELGLDGNTLVIFTSDNGPEVAQLHTASGSGGGSAGPFRGRKRSLYEGGIRVPLIMRWPGVVPAGRLDDSSVLCSVDYLPTLCALAGVGVPQGLAIDGEDVSMALRGGAFRRAKPLYWEFRDPFKGDWIHLSPWVAVREGNWKLLFNPDGSRRELYDVVADPQELRNQVAEAPDVAGRLEALAVAIHAEVPDAPVSEQAGQTYPWPSAR